jgi:hypothetical protein
MFYEKVIRDRTLPKNHVPNMVHFFKKDETTTYATMKIVEGRCWKNCDALLYHVVIDHVLKNSSGHNNRYRGLLHINPF